MSQPKRRAEPQRSRASTSGSRSGSGSPLSLRAETRRQLTRKRTKWSFGLLLALPLIVVAAFAIGDGEGPREGTFASVATSSAPNFAVFATVVSASFLLVVLAALFVGDSLPAEASWATLRYLLVAPVPRGKLLTSKLVVGVATMAISVFVLVAWSLLVGVVFYRVGDFTSPLGGTIEWGDMTWRLLLVAAYLSLVLLPVGALAFALGVRTDAPLAAVGGAVLVTIVATILGQIDNLGAVRSALPLYYASSWLDMLRPTIVWTDIQRGAAWAVLHSVLFITAAYVLFSRKDILS